MPTNLIPFKKYMYVATTSTIIQIIQLSIFFWIIKKVVMILITVTKESRYGKALGLLNTTGNHSCSRLAIEPDKKVPINPMNERIISCRTGM